MNYTELVTAIQDYTENYETVFNSQIPTFIKNAEQRIYNAVGFPAVRRNQIGNVTSDDKYLSLPSDYLATFEMSVIDPVTGAQTYLLDKDVNFIRESYPDPTDTGTPKYYAQFAPYTFLLGPTPDADYNFELHYYHYPASIVDVNTTWLGDNFDTVLLYGALREAYLFMKGEQDMITYVENKYQESLALLKQLGDGKDRRSAYRDGLVRIPVN